ncbi:unnamed protein product [Bursaphelenchus xylophilus]|uniref:(pine wood nematode) hypothetical protein n=1 Tax=Bursaphelenchus xylophilus TaxID=6326 RepID=A0A1I7STK5_BURXY|nr:unnamed protein product [Bursaphelenchus xylophilus]CAG9108293.1 unnamed protein product [Bursaphelenchus xylophilus]
MNVLLVIFSVNMFLLILGIGISWYDIRLYGSGLYLALVSIVTVVIVLAFCLVGTDEQTQPTVAKQMWSKSQQTIRRYTTVRRGRNNQVNLEMVRHTEGSESSNIICAEKVVVKVSHSPPKKQQSVRFNDIEEQLNSSGTLTASTSEPSAIMDGMVKLKMDLETGSSPDCTNDSSGIAGSENNVIYL